MYGIGVACAALDCAYSDRIDRCVTDFLRKRTVRRFTKKHHENAEKQCIILLVCKIIPIFARFCA